MAAEWYLNYGGVEVANHARLEAYLETVGSPLSSQGACGCPSFGAAMLEELPYTTPDDPDSPAPWYDPDVPASLEFAGLLVLDVAGLDDYPVQRTVTGGSPGAAPSARPARCPARSPSPPSSSALPAAGWTTGSTGSGRCSRGARPGSATGTVSRCSTAAPGRS